MIKAIVQRTIYLIEDTTHDLVVGLEVTDDRIKLYNENGDQEFVFNSNNTIEVRKKWHHIAKMIDKAIIMVERNRKQPKEFV
jgi:hypothetical protein